MAIICQCEAVRERTIVETIRRGADSIDAVAARCGATTRCGGCRDSVEDLLERHSSPAVAVRGTRVPAYAG